MSYNKTRVDKDDPRYEDRIRKAKDKRRNKRINRLITVLKKKPELFNETKT